MIPVNAKQRRQIAQREVPISYYLPLSHFNTPDIFECYDGSQGTVLALQGLPFELTDDETLQQQQNALHQALLQLTPDTAAYLTQQRYHYQPQAVTIDAPAFAVQFQQAYQAHWREHTLYHNRWYLTLLIKAPQRRQVIWQKFNKSAGSIERAKQQDKLIKLREIIVRLLNAYQPRILSTTINPQGQYSELLSFFGLLINGVWQPMRLPAQALNRYLPDRRLMFGFEALQWYGRHQKEHRFGAMLSIKQYSATTQPLILKGLLSCDCEYVLTQSYQPQAQTDTLAYMRKQKAHLRAVDDPAKSQVDELEIARDALGRGSLQFGWHHSSLLVKANDLATLDDKLAEVVHVFQAADIQVVRETLNLESVFWGQMPGNFNYIQRAALLSSINVADYYQLYHYPEGQRDATHLKRPVAVFPSRGRSAFAFHFHEPNSGNSQDLSKGHTTIIAPSHAGKTTLMTMLDCCMHQFETQSIFFDRDRGCEIYVRAMGGSYQRIQPDIATGFNPLQLPVHPQHQHFLQTWLTHLIAADDAELAGRVQTDISQTLERLLQLPQVERQLATFWHLLPTASPALEKLMPWLALEGQAPGIWHYLFDGKTDELDVSSKVLGFDLTHLLDHAPPQMVTAVMMYIFHRLEMRMDGRLMGIYLDEGWQYLVDPFWQAKLKSYLPTLRKKNVYLVFTTQSPGSVINSPLCDELIQGSATNIYLANPKARHDHYVKGFKLTEPEYQLIKTTPLNARLVLVKQQQQAAVMTCDLHPFSDAVAVFSANQSSLNLLDQLRADYGDDPERWLPVFQQERQHL